MGVAVNAHILLAGICRVIYSRAEGLIFKEGNGLLFCFCRLDLAYLVAVLLAYILSK